MDATELAALLADIVDVDDRIHLVPGDPALSDFEDRLSDGWRACLDDNAANKNDGFRVTSAFYRIAREAARCGAELVLLDLGPHSRL